MNEQNPPRSDIPANSTTRRDLPIRESNIPAIPPMPPAPPYPSSGISPPKLQTLQNRKRNSPSWAIEPDPINANKRIADLRYYMTVEVFQKQVNEIIQDGAIVPIESLHFDKPYWIGGFGLMC
ncbi:uncharacterized protein ASPGLDRAFT_52609 [Aspergillus glaucus CBS 516.65]|uniref:Uncharacterized protein n=1 Tax=Aspergillus glaucus CBS 516.65 TaxID=1160497 RepID=A0A1L9V6L7_ASPGL|nr:hypothetical protein ASPGLDRAFT_52609 [Aspergillus glaucus CBS 516.65]OJJ79558.1 hypothetical protein ASPGLDRAFT_52609 [Aspergillus glaucus CBS 516.65]